MKTIGFELKNRDEEPYLVLSAQVSPGDLTEAQNELKQASERLAPGASPGPAPQTGAGTAPPPLGSNPFATLAQPGSNLAGMFAAGWNDSARGLPLPPGIMQAMNSDPAIQNLARDTTMGMLSNPRIMESMTRAISSGQDP